MNDFAPNELNWEKVNGLMPVIIIETNSNIVLMQAYMNQEALALTMKQKLVTFYSRTKKRLWTKGETSGNFLTLVNITSDCDKDCLLIRVKPKGNVCHLDKLSCFGLEDQTNIGFLSYLENYIETRKAADPTKSYTKRLLDSGVSRIAQKVGEEAVEVALAAVQNNKEEFVNETADLLFHLMVLLKQQNLSLNQIIQVLEKRHQ